MKDIRKVYSQIYDQNIDKIYRFVYLKVNSEEMAQDITSEAFIKGWQAIQSQSIDNPRAFLYKVARNLVFDYYREKGRTQVVSAESVPLIDPRPSFGAKIATSMEMEGIKLALAKLNNDYQEVISLHYIDDLPVPEIAKIMDKSEGAVRVTLHRALNSLKNELKTA